MLQLNLLVEPSFAGHCMLDHNLSAVKVYAGAPTIHHIPYAQLPSGRDSGELLLAAALLRDQR